MAVHFSTMQKRKTLMTVAYLFLGLMLLSFAAGLPASQQKLEVHMLLNCLSKPAVKSIESPDGDVIDCVHISCQPAFDHPLLKNHTIQLRPNYYPEGLYDESKVSIRPKQGSNPISQLWHQNGRCPQGTIPIRRTKEDDVLRASSVEWYGKKKHRTIAKPTSVVQNGHEHAVAYVEGDKYYGAKASLNIWKPEVQSDEFSLSQLWIVGGPYENLNSVEAGFLVSPILYGDNNTRLFTYWTSDGYQTSGCFNLLCSGFIQTTSKIALGAAIAPVSAYRGSQYEISILLWKDTKEANWWLIIGDDHIVGYWPSSLFSYLANSASMIQWGGEVFNSEPDDQHTSTQMGSGHFAKAGYGKASYFRNIMVVDGSNHLRAPKGLATFAEKSNCYDIKLRTDGIGVWGNYFYYGGPGKNPKCP